jgi:hypothetical protein
MYTKMSVSKAVVQAVEQRGGRFLARDKQSGGVWTRVAYKRAVDKTSHAFRERDSVEEGQGHKTFDYEKDSSAEPDSFSGRQVNPNLGLLTEGAGPPGRVGELCNADERERQTALIHTPRLNEVPVCGVHESSYRWHEGDVQFRTRGAEPSICYLRSNAWARIVPEYISSVKNQNPPASFLQWDPTVAGWWIRPISTIVAGDSRTGTSQLPPILAHHTTVYGSSNQKNITVAERQPFKTTGPFERFA